YGWQLGELSGHRMIGHGGGINGFSTMISRYPDDRLAVIVLSNTLGSRTGAVADRIAKVMLGIEDKPVEKTPTEKPAEKPDEKQAAEKPNVEGPVDAALLESLTGEYQLGDVEMEMTARDGQLFAVIKGRPQDLLKYQGGRAFVHGNDSELRITFTPKEGK